MHIQACDLIQLQMLLHVRPAPAPPIAQLETRHDTRQAFKVTLKLEHCQSLCGAVTGGLEMDMHMACDYA